MFAVEIHTSDDRLDWRTDYDDLSYRITDVPAPMRPRVTDLMTSFGLAFGAFDFAVQADGQWRFLELNPNGQWAFIEDATGLPIADTFAVELGRGHAGELTLLGRPSVQGAELDDRRIRLRSPETPTHGEDQ